MAGESGAAAGAEWHGSKAFVNQITVKEVFENPPDRFDVFVFQGDIGVVEVQPIAGSDGDAVPFFEIFENRLAAFFVKFVDAIG